MEGQEEGVQGACRLEWGREGERDGRGERSGRGRDGERGECCRTRTRARCPLEARVCLVWARRERKISVMSLIAPWCS